MEKLTVNKAENTPNLIQMQTPWSSRSVVSCEARHLARIEVVVSSWGWGVLSIVGYGNWVIHSANKYVVGIVFLCREHKESDMHPSMTYP